MLKPSGKLLLVAATEMEVQGFLPVDNPGTGRVGRVLAGPRQYPFLSILITGPGVPATTFFLTRLLGTMHFDRVIDAGIAGSFRQDLPLGAPVNVVSDCFADLGADHRNAFFPLYGMEMARPYLPLFMNQNGEIDRGEFPETPSLKKLKKVRGITVNTVTGHAEAIETLLKRTGAEVESMEGAAVFFCCHAFGIPCLQIRTISNHIVPGHLAQWNIPPAVDSLKQTLTLILDEIS